MANIGNFALIMALALAAYGTLAAFWAAINARERLRQAAVRSYIVSAVLTLVAVVSLGYLIQSNDFSNTYVYGHSNITLPWYYKITAVWAGSQGSLLWWTLILMAYTLFYLFFTRKFPKLGGSWALGFVGMNLVFFLIINNFVANPFQAWHQIDGSGIEKLFFPQDGRGMNPQLQHWAMIIHPPLLYTGYIGFLFPFALTLGALITRLEGREWLPVVRTWTLVAWLILGVGIILGGGWAYMELGWGGYWAWDPVENASFMPWLLATAFIHSIMAQEKRGMFKMWNVLLLIGTYIMCLFGTFITRSGLISSVHAFAQSSIGNWFIGMIGVLTVVAVVVIAMRRDQLVDDNAYESGSSREVSLLFNNVLFVAICGLILLGVTFPMLHEFLYDTKRELRHGYYNTVVLPFFMGMLILMAVGPVLTWKRTNPKRIRERFLIPAVIGFLSGFPVLYLVNKGGYSYFPVFGTMCATFLGITIIQEFWEAGRQRSKRAGENLFAAMVSLVRMNKRRYGGYITHLSVLLMAIGFIGAAFNEQGKQDIGMGETMTVDGNTFLIKDIGFHVEKAKGLKHYEAMYAEVALVRNGKEVATFRPEQRFYMASESQASEVSIDSSIMGDYYVVLAGPGDGHSMEHPIGSFHIYVNPLVQWVWIGTIFMIFGTFIAMAPDLSRSRARSSAPAEAVGGMA